MNDRSFETFFLASAGAGGAFTGLLFVAISIAPKRIFGQMSGTNAPRQLLAEGTLVTMVNGFIVSSVALIPGVNVGWVALVVGIWGTVAAIDIAWRLYQFHRHGPFLATWCHQLRVVSLSLFATVVYVFETMTGLRLLLHENEPAALRALALTVTTLFAVGVLRAWILLGNPQQGVSGLLNPLQDRIGQPEIEVSELETR